MEIGYQIDMLGDCLYGYNQNNCHGLSFYLINAWLLLWIQSEQLSWLIFISRQVKQGVVNASSEGIVRSRKKHCLFPVMVCKIG